MEHEFARQVEVLRPQLLRYARTQRRTLLDWRPGVAADVVSDPERLAVASDSVDAVILPHTLERTASPHALLREVVANLVDNALRHTPAGGAVRITVTSHPPTLTVDDDGPGVPPDERERIFERFARGASANETGTGLGLAISRQLVELMGGRIGVESAKGQGATFWFELPLVRC